MAYATVSDVKARMVRDLSVREETVCATLLDDVAVLIDAYNKAATADAKKIVSCRVVERVLGDGGDGTSSIPIGATQGSVSALGYSQSWTIGAGSTGEMYLNKLEKKLLGTGNSIGSYSPTQELVPPVVVPEVFEQ